MQITVILYFESYFHIDDASKMHNSIYKFGMGKEHNCVFVTFCQKLDKKHKKDFKIYLAPETCFG